MTFTRLPEGRGGPSANAPTLSIEVDGRAVEARAGESVAVAMLAAGVLRFRTAPASGAPRAPFCMMGACYECLVEIDGRRQQACMTPVAAGQRVVTGQGLPALRRADTAVPPRP